MSEEDHSDEQESIGLGSEMNPGPSHSRRRVTLFALPVVLALVAVGIMVVQRLPHEEPLEAPTAPSPFEPAKVPGDLLTPDGERQLRAEFAKLETTIDGEIGLAIKPVGGANAEIFLGSWSSGPAWSTMKVPLSIAALREQPEPVVTPDMVAAITRSDNDSADALWRDLGEPPAAARKIEEVLRSAGDRTVVQDKKIRTDKPELSAFGQTLWPLTEQVKFLASAFCDKNDAPVFDLMGEVAADQRWGIGRLKGSRFKGGWGPAVSGAYLTRQMGVVQTPSGQMAVALAVQPVSGSFDEGTNSLSKIADWISAHEATLPAGTCDGVEPSISENPAKPKAS